MKNVYMAKLWKNDILGTTALTHPQFLLRLNL